MLSLSGSEQTCNISFTFFSSKWLFRFFSNFESEIFVLKNDFNFIIGVDGGVNLKTIDEVYKTGVDVTIVGSALYGADDVSNRFKQLMTIEND